MKLASGIYRHYKGKLYLVLGIAQHSETQEPLVVYIPLYEHEGYGLSVRPFEMFVECLTYQGHLVERFEYVGSHLPEKQTLVKDTTEYDKARAIHRVVRALHDGECPKCHMLHDSPDTSSSNAGCDSCPHCGFTITAAEKEAAMALFGPVMEYNLDIFNDWRNTL